MDLHIQEFDTGENTIMVELTVYDKRDQRNEEPTRVFFEVVGEMFGDAAPEVQFDSIATADGESFNGLESDIINITGTVVDNDASADCDVKVEASLMTSRYSIRAMESRQPRRRWGGSTGRKGYVTVISTS